MTQLRYYSTIKLRLTSLGKTFQSWDHVANFMKKFATAKGHGVRIGSGGKSKGYLKVTKFNDQHIGHECHPSASQFIPTLQKLPEEILEEI
ncbi:unnamed protein product [Rhizophagus irregularis]|nr:unnamed protein product [Rhizophagus irregularis]